MKNSNLKPLFYVCHQIQLQKTKMNRHRKEFKNIFWAQKCPIYQILDIIEIFFINPKQSFLIHYLILVIRYNFKKSNELRNTKVQKC